METFPFSLVLLRIYLWPLTWRWAQQACNKYLPKGVQCLFRVGATFNLPCGTGEGAGCGSQVALSLNLECPFLI